MDYIKMMRTLKKIVDSETLIDEDWIIVSDLIGYLRGMNPVNAFVDSMEQNEKMPKLETFSAEELAQMEFEPPIASELAERLRECESVVTDDGEWKYDRVPGDLVRDLLDYLESEV